MPDALSAPTGTVSTEFRREVEQQRLRLQRLGEKPAKNYSELATSSSIENAADADTDAVVGADEQRTAAGERGDQEYQGGNETPISGPSFLGLSGPEPGKQDLSYLYEDESRPGKGRKMLALLIAVGFLAFIAYEWRQNPNWQTTIVGRLAKTRANATGNNASAPQNTNTDQHTPSVSSPAPANNAEQNAGGATSPPPSASAQLNASSAQPGTQPESQSSGQAGYGNPGKPNQDNQATQASSTGDQTAQQPETNSTGTAGERESIGKQNKDATKPATKERAAVTEVKKATGVRTTAVAHPATTEQPDNDLVAKADAYLYGRGGVAKNCQQALVYLRTAANSGNAMARSKLGGLYATGHCVPLDRAEAYNWFTLSREAGNNNIWLERNREMLWSKMTADEKGRAITPPR